MRIVVIEDSLKVIENLRELIEGAGHHLQGIVVDRCWENKDAYVGYTCCWRPEQVQQAIQELQPDLILLDHNLGTHFSGETLARDMGVPKEKLFGISSDFKVQKDYCGDTCCKPDDPDNHGYKAFFLRVLQEYISTMGN